MRLISSILIDDYVPQAETCIVCQNELEVSTSHYGRVKVSQIRTEETKISYLRTPDGGILEVPFVHSRFFPKKVTGHACNECFERLYNITWRDKNNHLRRAFETLNPQVIQPKNDDYEASSVVKGLYAPHGGKNLKSVTIHSDREGMIKDRLDGFRKANKRAEERRVMSLRRETGDRE